MNLSNALREGVIENEFLPRYASLVQAGIVYGVTWSAASIAAPSATATGGFALFNPSASGVQLVLLKAFIPVITFSVGTTGAAFGLQLVPGQQPTVTSNGNVPQNMLVGSLNTSVIGHSFTAGTLSSAPTVAAYWFDSAYLDVVAGDVAQAEVDVDGAVIVGPNSGICLVMSGTLTATVAPSLTWAEVPLA